MTFTIIVTVPTGGNLVQRPADQFRGRRVADPVGPLHRRPTTIAHTYDDDDTYTVTVSVTDTANNVQTQQLVIAVGPAEEERAAVTPTVGDIVALRRPSPSCRQ